MQHIWLNVSERYATVLLKCNQRRKLPLWRVSVCGVCVCVFVPPFAAFDHKTQLLQTAFKTMRGICVKHATQSPSIAVRQTIVAAVVVAVAVAGSYQLPVCCQN